MTKQVTIIVIGRLMVNNPSMESSVYKSFFKVPLLGAYFTKSFFPIILQKLSTSCSN